MFKRANKITALLVAAASVMSLVPAMAADTTRLGTKEGTIENAVAFKDGKYVYEGYRTNSEDDSVYYNAGDKDKELTDVKDASLYGSYADKYAFAKDGSDEYIVDLTDGKVIDDETPEDKLDTTATKLKSALKKTDRYGDTITVDSNNNLTSLGSGTKFGEEWYGYNITTSTSDATKNLFNSQLYGYTNNQGKYIDASNVANIYAYSSEKNKVVKIEEFNNDPTDPDTDTKLRVELTEAPQFLAQDKDNIYQKVSVKITDTSTKVSTPARPTVVKVNFDNAGTEISEAVVGSKATADVAFTIGAATDTIVFNGITYTNDATPGAAASGNFKYNDLATLAAAINANDSIYSVTAAGKVTANNNGVQATLKTAAGTGAGAAVVSNFVNGTDDVAIGSAPTFTVGNATTFTYDSATKSIGETGYVAADAVKYNSIADLKAKFKAYVTLNGGTAIETGAVYDSSTGTVTIPATVTAGTIATDFDDTNAAEVVQTGSASSTSGNARTATFIQKLAKAQGENKDEALLPKSVASYELTKNYYDSGDSDDAFDAADDSNVSWQVTDGTLFAVKNTGSNVKVTTMKLVKDKVKFQDATTRPTQISEDDKVDVYLVQKGDDDDTDIDKAGAVSVDVNGNIWAIHEGKVMKFEKSEFKDKFTCDRSMDELDVYDETSLIAWEKSGDVYTTVNEGTKVTQDESTAVAPVVVTGWVQDGANWSFNDATGTKVTNKWVNVGGAWYFLKADGVMATNWYNDNGTWYYLKSSGAMATGWVNDNGTWYYCNASGAMLANTTVDGYVLNASGAWVK